jgi:hypothetical protein
MASKTLTIVQDIDAAIQKAHGGRCMDSDDDRAEVAWWAYQTFCKGDWRKNLYPEITRERAGGGGGNAAGTPGGAGGQG